MCVCVLRSRRYENLTTKKTRSLVHELGIATVGSVTLVCIHHTTTTTSFFFVECAGRQRVYVLVYSHTH